MVQNCDLTFDNVLVDKSQKLEKGNRFFTQEMVLEMPHQKYSDIQEFLLVG